MLEKVVIILVSFLSVSCNENNNEVEIYLLNNVKPNIEGVKYSTKDPFETTTYDSVIKKTYKWGNFNYTESDLNKEPFIQNHEILNLDTIKGIVEFDNAAGSRIIDMTKGFKRSRQFVITVNGNLVMNGFFHNIYSSYGTDWNTIQFEDVGKLRNKNFKTYMFSFHKGKGIEKPFEKDKINFKNYPLLIEALEVSNRLKNIN